jgi:hypothetical protein
LLLVDSFLIKRLHASVLKLRLNKSELALIAYKYERLVKHKLDFLILAF